MVAARRVPRVWPYGRFSSNPQEQGDSRRRQDESVARWIAARGVPSSSVQTAIFDSGLSGFHGGHLRDNGGLAQFLKQIESGVVRRGDFLVVENFDRLSRLKPTVAQELILRIVRAGINIAVCEGDYELSEKRLNSGDGTLWRLIGEVERAHRESARKSGMISASWEEKRKLAANGVRTQHKCPAWLRWNETKRRYEAIPERAKAIREVYRLAMTMGTKAIVRALQEKPSEFPPFGSTGGWTTVYVQKLLKERMVLGELEHSRLRLDADGNAVLDKHGRKVYDHVGNVIPDYYPRVITDNVFAKVRARLEKRAFWDKGGKLDSIPNLFSGLVACGCCGHMLNLRDACKHTRAGKQVYRYYRCKRYTETAGKGCATPGRIEKSRLEGIVLAALQQDLAGLLGENDRDPVAALRDELEGVEAEIEVLSGKVDGWAEALSGLSDRARGTVQAKLNNAISRQDELEKRRDTLRGQIESASTVERDLDGVREVLEMAVLSDTASRAKVRSAISSVVESIVVDNSAGDDVRVVIRVRGLRYAAVVVPGEGDVAIRVASEREERLLRAILAE